MFFKSSSAKKKSCTPATKGASGPTTTILILLSNTAFLTALKSVALSLILVAIFAVPAFPGNTKS